MPQMKKSEQIANNFANSNPVKIAIMSFFITIMMISILVFVYIAENRKQIINICIDEKELFDSANTKIINKTKYQVFDIKELNNIRLLIKRTNENNSKQKKAEQ